MKITTAENLRHFLGDLATEGAQVFVDHEESGGFYEIVAGEERNGCVVLKLGDYHHALPHKSDGDSK